MKGCFERLRLRRFGLEVDRLGGDSTGRLEEERFQATPPPASVKAVAEICVTCGGAHPYYQCLVAGGNTFLELRDNIQGYVATAAINYNQGNSVYRPPGPTSSCPKSKPPSQINFVVHQRDPLHPNNPYPSRMLNQKQQEKDEVQIHKFWKMFKQLHINITLADALILIPKYQKMLKALLSNKEKLLELANTHLNENCSAVILKKLPEKLGDPGKFLIPCGFNELKCKALADLGASINLMPLSVWRKLADFVIVDYESDPRVPLLLGRPFLRTARALLNVHGEEMILCDGDERLTLNIRHDTSSYSNQPQKESINLINVFNDSSEDFLENLFSTNHQSGNPTFSSHLELTSPKVKNDIFDPEGGNVLPKKLLDLDSTKDLHPPHHVNPLSGSTTSSSPNQLLEEFADELALIIFPPGNDDLPSDIDNLDDLNDNLVDSMPDMFTDEHALDYSSPLLYDEYDDLFEVKSNTENVYDDPFDSKGEKIKEFKLLIDELDLPCDFLLPSEYDSFFSKGFSEVDALPSTNNEDKEPCYLKSIEYLLEESLLLLNFVVHHHSMKIKKIPFEMISNSHEKLLLHAKEFHRLKFQHSLLEISLSLKHQNTHRKNCEINPPNISLKKVSWNGSLWHNYFAVIAGYGDVVIGSTTIKKVYYVEDGVDLLTGDRSLNLYTIALNEVASNSSACLIAKASSSQSWLWHQHLSHLNFTTINNLVKNNLVRGLPKMKFEKDHLCFTCEQGKIHRKHHKSKTAFASNKPLYLLHMDVCGRKRVESINGQRYVLVVVDDYSQYTWVFYLHSKDEASEVIISFIKKTQVNL
nr:reverse transcriptase domain-containing protein [Tanacetum cinerariifolium]